MKSLPLGSAPHQDGSSGCRWSQWAKRDWAAYVGQRAADNAEGVDSRNPLNKPSKHANRH